MNERYNFTPAIVRDLMEIESARQIVKLTVLPPHVAERLRQQARFFQRQVFEVGERDIVVIPDADFLSPYKNERFFLEVEQTAKFEHILEKYQKYARIFSVLSEDISVWLVMGFPDFKTFDQLRDEHRRAASSVAASRPLNFYYCICSVLHAQKCETFDNTSHLDERGNWKTDAYGFKSYLNKLLD